MNRIEVPFVDRSATQTKTTSVRPHRNRDDRCADRSAQQAGTLHEIRFLGNDAAHDLDQPSTKSVAIALDIVEHLLEQVCRILGLAKVETPFAEDVRCPRPVPRLQRLLNPRPAEETADGCA